MLDYDIDQAKKVKLVVYSNGKAAGDVKFQFPPKIISDNKDVEWQVKNLKSYEPLKIFMSAKSRAINVKLKYVVYGSWTGQEIRNQIVILRRTAYPVGTGGQLGAAAPFVKFEAYNLSPTTNTTPTWRLEGMSIKYSEELVGRGSSAYPLETDVNLKLELTTSGANILQGKGTTDGNTKSTQHRTAAAGKIPIFPDEKWY